jgi:hypothetical protein
VTVALRQPAVSLEELRAWEDQQEDRCDIRRYILPKQDAIAADVYARDADLWVCSTVTGDGALVMPEIDVAMPLAHAYAGLELGT